MRATILAVLLLCSTALAQQPFTQAIFMQNQSAPTVYPLQEFTSWQMDSNYWAVQELTSQTTTFGGPAVWDGASNVFRAMAQGVSDNKLYQYTSSDGRIWSNRTLALDLGSAGTYDAGSIGVPFIWNEVGQTRPWRMIYRGAKVSSQTLCLATSTDGWTWERKDTAGNALTTCVYTNSAFSGSGMDFGNVFKVGSTYYLYFDSIGTPPPRMTGLITSTDLVNWTQQPTTNANNAYFFAATNSAGHWDYDDKTHTSGAKCTAGNIFGWYCPWVGRWDKLDGTTNYVMFIPTTGDWGTNMIACFSSPVPDFNVTNRTFQGWMFNRTNGEHYVFGNKIADTDVPRVYCDDITQNPITSFRMGSNLLMWVAAIPNTWSEMLCSRPSGIELPMDKPTSSGAYLSGVQWLLPNNNPTLHLALSGDTNVIFQFQPGSRGVLNDLAGYSGPVSDCAFFIPSTYIPNDSNGVLFTRANSVCLGSSGVAHLSQFDRLTNNFTIEFKASKASLLGNANLACPVSVSGNSARYIVYVWLTGSTTDSAVNWTVAFRSGGATSSKVTGNFSWLATDTSLHTWCFMRTNNVFYWFKDGALQEAGQAWTQQIDVQTAADPIRIGANGANSLFWDGYIDEVRISANGRYATNGYTPGTLPLHYATTGYIFTRVYDFGSSVPAGTVTTYGTTPAGCSVSVSKRVASSITDKSITVGDFGAGGSGQYQQFLITLTGDGTSTPTITGIVPHSP